jgi:hypothetical protein
MRTSSLVVFLALLFVAPLAGAAGSSAPAVQGDVAPGDQVQVVLKDGQVVRGRLVEQSASMIVLESSGARLSFPTDAVRELSRAGAPVAPPPSARVRDPNRARYLYSPSGFMLNQGEGYVEQTELIFTTANVGVTDWLSLQAGTSLPWLIYHPSTTPVVFGAKIGGGVTDWLHLSLSFAGYKFVSADPGGLAFATATFGSEDLNLGISVAKAVAYTDSSFKSPGKAFGTLSGVWRVSNSIALVSENWIFDTTSDTYWIGSAAVRFISDGLGVDAGLTKWKGVPLPIPWLDFTFHWN